MSWQQQYLPIFEEGKGQVLGLYRLEGNTDFEGTETEFELPGAPPDADYTVKVKKIVPVNTRALPNEFMAAVFTRQQVNERAHRGYSCYVPVEEAAPAHSWMSGSGLANVLFAYNGPIIDGITNQQGFRNGPPVLEDEQ